MVQSFVKKIWKKKVLYNRIFSRPEYGIRSTNLGYIQHVDFRVQGQNNGNKGKSNCSTSKNNGNFRVQMKNNGNKYAWGLENYHGLLNNTHVKFRNTHMQEKQQLPIPCFYFLDGCGIRNSETTC